MTPLLDLETEFDRGVSAHQAGDLSSARICYERVLLREPAHSDALHLLGLVRLAQGDTPAAILFIQQSLSIQPQFADAHNNLGTIFEGQNRPDEAVACYLRALSLRPEYLEALNNLGNVLQKQKKYSQAIICYRRAVAIDPCFHESYSNLSAALYMEGKFSEAAASAHEALALKPNSPKALCNLGNALKLLGDLDGAVASYRKALLFDSSLAEACNNLGASLHAQSQIEDAIVVYRRALELNPNFAEAHNNLGYSLQALNKLDEAIACYKRAAEIKPNYTDTLFNESLAQLLKGNFRLAWKNYEHRWSGEQKTSRRYFAEPQWTGVESLSGKSILLHAEQGIGDTLQFLRFLPRFAETGAIIFLEVQSAIKPLLVGRPSIAAIYVNGEPLPKFDFHCPLLSLPLAFGTELETIPSSVPYLEAPVERVDAWRKKIPRGKQNIGVVWSGNPQHRNDHNRSIPLSIFTAILRSPDINFFVLQKDVTPSDASLIAPFENVSNLSAEIHDVADTAAIIKNLDLVITVDTSVAHLAGALGKPAWILITHAPDWRWLLNRTDSPWYPTVRLFRQQKRGDWEGVVASVRATLSLI